MNLKITVAVSLVLSFFLVGNILLFGISPSSLFFYLYFFFSICWLALLAYSIKSMLSGKGDFAVLVVAILFFAFAITFFMQSVKTYSDKNQEFISNNKELMLQINNLSNANDYYLSYADYLNQQIDVSRSNSIKTEAQIAAIQQNQESSNAVVTLPEIREDEEWFEEEEDD